MIDVIFHESHQIILHANLKKFIEFLAYPSILINCFI